MKKINFIFGVHNHQPIGNFDSVFEDAFQKAYKPFLEKVEKFSKIKVSYHNTGILYDWLEQHHPPFLDKIREMTNSGQLELLTGGYYEPILSVIPDDDKVGQINKHRSYITDKFNYEPKGLWLAERVWEQHLVKSLSSAKVKFIVIDDTHFKYAGFKGEDLKGYFLTEEQGCSLSVFPINKTLRGTIPFRVVEETIEYLRSLATEDGDNIAVFADDGEKFGFWPETFHSVYEEGWLERFFTALEANSDWINIIHFSEALEKFSALGLVYLPNASYSEMMHWALPNTKSYCEYDKFEKTLKQSNLFEDYNQFVRGGFWRNFMAKYPESNHLHKKMLRISCRARKIQDSGKNIDTALNKIWMGQCNCPYWHGVWGGLYLPNLRSPIYRSLIEAENELDKIEKVDSIKFDVTDFNFDGKNEVLIESPIFNLYFSPANGGALYEFDYKPVNFNILDILSRREEGYHKKLTEKEDENINYMDRVRMREDGLESFLFYDWYRRGSLIDHFLGEETNLEKMYKCRFPEQGDFVNQPYEYSTDAKSNCLNLFRNGYLWHGSERYPLKVSKEIQIYKGSEKLGIKYKIDNLGKYEKVPIWFGIEFNFGLLAGNAPDRYYIFPGFEIENGTLNSKGIIDNCNTVELIDKWLGIKITLTTDKMASFWRFPIETISLSEYGFERVYQSSVVLPNWKFELKNKQEIEIGLKVERI